MQFIKNLKSLVLVGILIAVPVVLAMSPAVVSAHDGEDHSEEVAQADDKQESSEAEKVYKYTAQPGDSFAAMARKAVQTHGINNNVNLSQAQIVFAETNLTLAADSPILNEGQEVTIAEADVKTWVDKAGQLSDVQKSAWEAYTVGVNFNTDNVGEARS